MSGETTATASSTKALFMTHNAAVQPQIRAQREFVGWNCLLEVACSCVAANATERGKTELYVFGRNTGEENVLL